MNEAGTLTLGEARERAEAVVEALVVGGDVLLNRTKPRGEHRHEESLHVFGPELPDRLPTCDRPDAALFFFVVIQRRTQSREDLREAIRPARDGAGVIGVGCDARGVVPGEGLDVVVAGDGAQRRRPGRGGVVDRRLRGAGRRGGRIASGLARADEAQATARGHPTKQQIENLTTQRQTLRGELLIERLRAEEAGHRRLTHVAELMRLVKREIEPSLHLASGGQVRRVRHAGRVLVHLTVSGESQPTLAT
jgi:hypothetical protein